MTANSYICIHTNIDFSYIYLMTQNMFAKYCMNMYMYICMYMGMLVCVCIYKYVYITYSLLQIKMQTKLVT